MHKILKLTVLSFCIITFAVLAKAQQVYNGNVFKVGVSMDVPVSFFGVWRVHSELISTNSPANFKMNNVDLWNISKSGDVINLSNPFSGASASIDVKTVDDKTITFVRSGNYDGKILTDTVEITLDNDKFTGKNNLQLQTLSDIDSSIIKTSDAQYSLRGEKIAGMNILGR